MNWYGQSIHNGGGCQQPLDQFLWERYFQERIEQGTFIEAGALDGVKYSTCKALEEMGWRGINIEPSEEMYPRLLENRPKCINLNIALSDTTGIETFKCSNFDDGAFGHLKTTNANPAVIPTTKTHLVAAWTYNRMIAALAVRRVDLFVLDVEGSELYVLKGLQRCPVLPGVLCVEHVNVGAENIVNMLLDEYTEDFRDPQNVFLVRRKS